jgi:GT2 family glycosyltransferase
MISIIIPTRSLKRKKNLKHLLTPVSSLPDLLSDIEMNVHQEYEVIIVVNGNTDKKLLKYLSGKDQYNIVINNKNIGVSRAWNMGRHFASGEYLLYLNDDVRLFEGAMEQMLDRLKAHSEIGVVGPQGSIWENFEHVRFGGEIEAEETTVVSGFAFMTPTEVFDKVGGFDNNYTPAGFEEIDYCYKVRREKLKCFVDPEINVKTEPCHGISALNTDISFLNEKINTNDLHKRNKEYFIQKWKNNGTF